MSYTIFETFVGAGGTHIGFCKNGFTSKYVNDIEPMCLKTLVHNNPEIKETAFIDSRSILDLDAKELLSKTNMKNIDKLPDELKISKFYSRGSTMRLDGNKPNPTLVAAQLSSALAKSCVNLLDEYSYASINPIKNVEPLIVNNHEDNIQQSKRYL